MVGANPLNLIRVNCHTLLSGTKAGPLFHARYFQLKNYDNTTREEYVEKRRGAYTAYA